MTYPTPAAVSYHRPGKFDQQPIIHSAYGKDQGLADQDAELNEQPSSEPNRSERRKVRKKKWQFTPWPVIGGEQLNIEPSSLFSTPDFLDRYRPGEGHEIYMAASQGLSRLAKRFNLGLYKIGDCAEGRIGARMHELGASRYGGYYCSQDGELIEEAGFDHFFPSFIGFGREVSPNSPVTSTPRGIIVDLPDTMTGKQFSRALERELASAALHSWVGRQTAQDHFNRLRVPLQMAERFSLDQWGSEERVAQATELYLCRSNADGDRLVAIAEAIILKHMGLID